MRNHVIRADRDLATATWPIDDIGGHSITSGMPAQVLDDIDPSGNSGAKMPGANNRIALINVIRAHTDL